MKHIEVDQIAYNDQTLGMVHQVQVSLSDYSWAKLCREISRAVFRASVAKQRPFTWMMVAGAPAGLEGPPPSQRIRAHQRVRQILGHQAPSWALTPQEAMELGQALLEAAEDPSWCICGRVIEQPTSQKQCSTCEDRS